MWERLLDLKDDEVAFVDTVQTQAVAEASSAEDNAKRRWRQELPFHAADAPPCIRPSRETGGGDETRPMFRDKLMRLKCV